MLRPIMFAAAVLGGVPDVPWPVPAKAATPAAERTPRPAPAPGQGGPYEPVEQVTVVVEARPVETPRPFTIAPDPELARRYAPRDRAPANRLTIPF